MNATHTLDHLDAISHVSEILAATGAVAVNQPKAALTSHYDPTGTTLASISNTSYDGLTYNADGTVSGGTLSHVASTPEGLKLSSTSVGFHTNGKPLNATIEIQNIHSAGVFKKIALDMSGTVWNDAFGIASGSVKLKVSDGQTSQMTHDGEIEFQNETPHKASFAHYTDGSTISGYHQMDYSETKFLGTTLVGGQYDVSALNADKRRSSTSTIAMNTQGRPVNINTVNVDATSAVRSAVVVDFSGVNFTPRNQPDAGSVTLKVKDHEGILISHTAVSFQQAKPSGVETHVYEGETLKQRVVVDYSASRFNNKNEVVSSFKKVNIFAADNTLLSSRNVYYDAAGKRTDSPAQALSNPAPEKLMLSGPGDQYVPATPVPIQQWKKTPIKRPDGTLLKERDIYMVGPAATQAVITYYGPDGNTVIRKHTLDLTKMSFDNNAKKVSGSVNLQTHLGGTTLTARTTIQY